MRELLLYILGATVIVAGIKTAVPEHERVHPRTDRLFVDSATLVYLESIAETTYVETARCVSGYQETDTVFVLTGVFETPWLVTKADSQSLVFHWELCPHGTSGWWHTHPWRRVRKLAAEQEVSPWNWCGPSPTDTALPKRFPFMLISIRRNMTCIFLQAPDGVYKRIDLVR